MNMLKKIDLKKAALINIFVIALAIIVHFLVIIQVIPYNWVSGGQLETYEMQKQVSIFSILILLVTVPINLWGGKIILKNKFYVLLKILLIILCAYFAIGFFMQILGTLFEKIAMSVLCLIHFIMYLRMAIEKNE